MALGDYRGPSSCKAFVRYVISKYNERQTMMTCALYIADTLRQHSRGYYLTKSLYEVLFPSEVDERSAEDIIDDIASRLEA